jgi:hypothetical protein
VFIVSLGIKSIITSISYASPDVNTFRQLNNLSKDKGKISDFRNLLSETYMVSPKNNNGGEEDLNRYNNSD